MKKKFIAGFVSGALLFGTAGALAVQYVASPAGFKVLVNGKEFTSDPPALVVEGRTYLPLRAIGDALGIPVSWNEELQQAEVGTTSSASGTSGVQYSRSNPAPINTVQTYSKTDSYDEEYTVNVRVMEVIRGDDAYTMLRKANRYNDPAPDGYEYVLVKVALSVLSVEDDGSVNASSMGYKFKSFSNNNEESPDQSAVEPEPNLEGMLYAGGNTEGWIARLVKKDDAKPKLAFGLDYDGKGGIWFALYN